MSYLDMFTVDWSISRIIVKEPYDTVTVQDIINYIRYIEASDIGIAYSQIADATGKYDLGGGVYTGIIVKLLGNWRIRFWAGVGLGIIKEGTLTGGQDGQPAEPTPGSGDTVLVLNQVGSTLVYMTRPANYGRIALRESRIRTGDTARIVFLSQPNRTVTIEIYDPNNNKVYSGTMVEIADGVYELSIPFSTAWGTGDFLIKCKDTVEELADTAVVTVLSEEDWFATVKELKAHERRMIAFKLI